MAVLFQDFEREKRMNDEKCKKAGIEAVLLFCEVLKTNQKDEYTHLKLKICS